MAIKIIGSTIIDDSRNIVNAGIATVTSVSIGNTQVISSARQLQNIASLDATQLNISGVSTFTGITTSTSSLFANNLRVSGITTTGILNVGTGGTIITTTSTGSVGIGITNPGAKLYVNGGANNYTPTASGTGLFEVHGGTSTYSMYIGIDDQGGYIGHNGSGRKLFFDVNETTRMTIDSSGNLGIGTTTPGARLHAIPTSTGIAGLFSGTTSSDMVRITQLGTGNALVVEDSANPDTTPFVVTGIGSVGIGTTNPSSLLDVFGSTITLGDNSTNSGIIIRRNTNSALVFGGGSSGGNISGANIELYGSTHASVADNAYYDAKTHTFRNTGATVTHVAITTSTSQFNNVVLVGTGTSTGTASQTLQVTGGAYFSGAVGVGTTLPFTESSTGTFTISGSQVSKLYLEDTGYEATGSGVGQLVYDNGNLSWSTGSRNGSTTTGSSELFRVLEGGNLGIGTTNPQTKLQVNGVISLGTTNLSGINSIRSVTDINSWEYFGISKSINAEETSPQDIFFKNDGTKMFILGSSGDDVNEYALSSAWDVSTAGFTTNFSVAAQDTAPVGLYFRPNGLNMYVSGQTGVAPLVASGDYVHQYTLGTAWDLSNVGLATVGWTTSYRINEDSAPLGVYLKNDDGSKMYVVGNTNQRIYEYALGTAWNVSTAGLTTSILIGTGTTQNLPLTLTSPTGISFNASGTKMYISDLTRDVVARFDLLTAWDISTAVFYDNVYVGFQETNANGIFYQEDQSKAYLVGATNDAVFQYNTDVPSLELASSGISTRSSIILNNEARLNNRLYVTEDAHFSKSVLIKDSLTVENDIVITDDLTVSGGTITAGNVATDLLSGNTTTAITFAALQSSGALTVGGTAQTGTMTINRSTVTHTLNIDAGVSLASTIKTINFGTGGAANSFTRINIGPSAGVGTVGINTGTIVGVGTLSPQANLDVCDLSANPSVSPVIFIQRPNNVAPASVGVTNAELRIKGHSANHKIYVEDQNANPLFIVEGDGSVGIGTTNPVGQLQVSSGPVIIGAATSTGTASQRLQVTGGVYVSGSVGVGTTNPLGKLHAFTSRVITANTDADEGVFENNGNSGISILSGNAFTGQVVFGRSGTNLAGSIAYDHSDDSFRFLNAGSVSPTEAVRITSNQSVGIGTTNPGKTLHVRGGIRNTTRNSASTQTALHINTTTGDIAETASSRRFKRNIQNYTKGLETIVQLRPVSFQFLEDDLPNSGLIAEEVHEVGLPEFIRYDGDGNAYSIPYDNLSALYINSIKQLKEENDILKTQIANLTARLDASGL